MFQQMSIELVKIKVQKYHVLTGRVALTLVV